MFEEFKITPETTVREINKKFPQCTQVFEEMGMGGCGGALGPEEPLWVFAQAHRVNLDELITRLKDAVSNPQKYAKLGGQEEEDTRYFVPFVKCAILIGIFLGVAFGLYNLILIGVAKNYQGPSYAAVQAHGHAQFFGWVGLMIMGILAFILPRFKTVKFRYAPALYVVLGAMLVSLIAQAIARPYAQLWFNAQIVFASAVLELFALCAYAVLILLVYKQAKFSLEAYDLFVIAGLAWFLVAGILHLTISGIILETKIGAVDAPINSAYLTALAFGLSGNMIFGVAIRALPTLIGFKPSLTPRFFVLAFLLYNSGTALRCIPAVSPIISSPLILAGGALTIYALRVFESFSVRTAVPGLHLSSRLLVFYSFGFFIIATLMLIGGDAYSALTRSSVPHEYIGAFRHAITVGFITAMMLGVGYRILPVFSGSTIPSFILQAVSAGLLMIGNIWRVGFELLTLSKNPVAFRLMPLSGVMELLAIILFGYLIWQTLSSPEAVAFDGEITPNTKVRALLDAYPWAREVLISAGLIQLAVVHRPPPFVTLKMAALMHKVSVEELIAALKNAQDQYLNGATHKAESQLSKA